VLLTFGRVSEVTFEMLYCTKNQCDFFFFYKEMFGLRQSQWTFTTPSVFFKFGSEMRISFFTIVTYLLLAFIFDSKIAHAWSVLFFTIANVSVFVNTAFSKKIKSQ
jgi:hypothetical protein